ncbi:MAG: HNH endonuclease [Chloroflexi bacterium]|nr:HNH endonuclease [Chloroflexota bacterium]
MQRDEHPCPACGATGVRFEVGHIVPLAAGGSNSLANLRTCASRATGTDVDDWHRAHLSLDDGFSLIPPSR